MTDSTFNKDGSKGPDVTAHVTATEVHGYLTSSLADAAVERRVSEHLESCDACRDHALEMQRKTVSQIRADQPAGPECFSSDVLQEVAAGVFRNDTQQILDHASCCWHCAELLCADLEAFSGFQTPESAEFLARLKTSSAAWPEKFARASLDAANQGEAPARRQHWSMKPVWALVGVAAAAAIALVFFFPRQSDLQRAESQLAVAYGQQRTIAMRIPAFPHAELKERQVLRAAGAVGDYPPAFREVQRLLAEQKLQAKPSTPEWEHVRARMELLEGTDESVYRALRWLERTAQAAPERADLQLDLAVAYYERESRAETPNMMRVIDILAALLSRKDLAREDRAAALFNLALAFEKSEAWDLAVAKWEEYLQLDPDSAWGREARAHLDAARKHLPQSRAPSPPNTEDRLDAALRKVLPQKLQARPETPESTKASAELDTLAADMVKDHRDPWLRDFLAALRPNQTAAALDLSAAVDANAKGQYAKVLEYAARAERGFAARGNTAGVLRAQFEQVYAYHRFLKGKECLLRANALKTKTDATSYGWIKTQLATERAICLDYVGSLEETIVSFDEGLRLAQDARYEVLILRNLGITAGQDRLHGNCKRSWQNGVRGLRRYWKGSFPAVRLYQLYFAMQACAEQQQMWNAAEVFFRQAVVVLDASENKTQVGIAHLRLATLLTVLNRDVEAEEQVQIGQDILARTPQDPSVVAYRLSGQVTLASLQMRRGRPAAALQALRDVDVKKLTGTDASFVSMNYLRVLGDVHLRMANLEFAEGSFRQAIRMAEPVIAGTSADLDRLRWINESESAYRGLTRTLLTRKQDSDALAVWESYRGGLFHKSDKSRFRRALDSHTPSLRLIYASFEDGLQLWVERQGVLEAAWISIKQEELSRRIQKLVELAADPKSDLALIRGESRQLYGPLLGPARVQGSEEELVIETDGVLAGLPFELLVAPNGKFLGEQLPITYSPGAVYEREVSRKLSARTQQSLLILDPLATLPGRAEEVAAVKAGFDHVKVLRAPELNRASVLQALPEVSVLHFVGHGKLIERRAGLLLADGESRSDMLLAEDLPPAHLRSLQMAVLAGCSTGESDGHGLFDPDSFVSALVRGGVPVVISSKWNVDSSSTSALMQVFYRRLAAAEHPAVAMHKARWQVVANHPHPFYWSAFVVTGKASSQKGNGPLARSYQRVEEVR